MPQPNVIPLNADSDMDAVERAERPEESDLAPIVPRVRRPFAPTAQVPVPIPIAAGYGGFVVLFNVGVAGDGKPLLKFTASVEGSQGNFLLVVPPSDGTVVIDVPVGMSLSPAGAQAVMNKDHADNPPEYAPPGPPIIIPLY